MIKMFLIALSILTFAIFMPHIWGQDCQSDLMRDLMIVDYWNQRINDRLPVTFNHFLQGGYINMPSGRMGADGEIGIGYSKVPPYINYNLRVQFTDRLELSGSYRIFKGVDDPILSPMGFGDLSDKGANLKLALFLPEDSGYSLPGIAVGLEDFIGTQNFRSRYLVLTQVFLDYDSEISLGYGQHRLKGWFGGLLWMPFRRSSCCYLKGLSLTAEYDATPYSNHHIELHPKGRKSKSPINVGVKYRLWDQFDCSLSLVRGHKLAFSVSGYYNFGYTKGFVPKIDDVLPYQSPVNTQCLGILRPEDVLVSDLLYPLNEQGFDLLQAWLSYQECQKILRLRILNNNYRLEEDVRERLTYLMGALIPSNIDEVIVVIESDAFPIQEYHFRMPFVRAFKGGKICVEELNLLTPLTEVTYPDKFNSRLLFKRGREWWNLEIFPKTHTFFGSSRGKFKYALGVHIALDGFLFGELYYSLLLGCTFISNLDHLSGVDRLNPSQIINVRSDIVEYYKRKGVNVDEAFVQKNWNMGRGWYSRIAAGLFEQEYGGVAGEVLYYPIDSPLAFGLESAYLRKRALRGVGFKDVVRKLNGFEKTYKKFIGKQYFLNLYYSLYSCMLDFEIKAGKFLANDWGARFQLTRYFPSGLRLNMWYTWTNGNDRINGKTYHDQGVSFSMPLDIFYTHSERSRFGNGLSAWLRDVGVVAYDGKGLFELINEERE